MRAPARRAARTRRRAAPRGPGVAAGQAPSRQHQARCLDHRGNTLHRVWMRTVFEGYVLNTGTYQSLTNIDPGELRTVLITTREREDFSPFPSFPTGAR